MAQRMDVIMPIGSGEMPGGGSFFVGLSPDRLLVFTFDCGATAAVRLSDVAVSVRAAMPAGRPAVREKLRSRESIVVVKKRIEEDDK